jgi:hypothetical protein
MRELIGEKRLHERREFRIRNEVYIWNEGRTDFRICKLHTCEVKGARLQGARLQDPACLYEIRGVCWPEC